MFFEIIIALVVGIFCFLESVIYLKAMQANEYSVSRYFKWVSEEVGKYIGVYILSGIIMVLGALLCPHDSIAYYIIMAVAIAILMIRFLKFKIKISGNSFGNSLKIKLMLLVTAVIIAVVCIACFMLSNIFTGGVIILAPVYIVAANFIIKPFSKKAKLAEEA